MMYLSLFFQDSKNSNLKTSVVFGEGVAPCRQCTSMLLVIPPLGFVFPENCEVPEVGTHNKNSTIQTCVFFSNRKSHHSRCTSNKSLSNALAAVKHALKSCCFFVFFGVGFLRLKAVRSNQSQLCWELWCFVVFFGRSRRRRKN